MVSRSAAWHRRSEHKHVKHAAPWADSGDVNHLFGGAIVKVLAIDRQIKQRQVYPCAE